MSSPENYSARSAFRTSVAWPFGRHFVPDGADFAIGADPIRHAHDAQKRFTQEAFHAARAVRLDHFEFRVGQQRKSQLVL